MGLLSRCYERSRSFFAPALALAAVAMFGVQSAMADAITLPATGVDVGGHITAGIVAVGAVVIIAVGGYFAFLVIRKGIRWARMSMG